MLYDPKWNKETKADPFSLESLIAWLEKRPASETYCYQDQGECLLGQYLQASGISEYSLGNLFLKLPKRDTIHLHEIGFMQTAMPLPHTFGGALTRARKALADQRKFETASAVGS